MIKFFKHIMVNPYQRKILILLFLAVASGVASLVCMFLIETSDVGPDDLPMLPALGFLFFVLAKYPLIIAVIVNGIRDIFKKRFTLVHWVCSMLAVLFLARWVIFLGF